MKRSTIDKVISTTGLVVAAALLVAAVALFYTQAFIHNQVKDQLAAERIVFPAEGSVSLLSLPDADKEAVSKYAGQQLVTGVQAEVFANHYISAHINKIGGGKTYSELSSEARKDPTDKALASKVDTVFKGQTLRGMLLTTYAFDTMATVALLASYGAAIAGALLVILSILGFSHSKKATTKR